MVARYLGIDCYDSHPPDYHYDYGQDDWATGPTSGLVVCYHEQADEKTNDGNKDGRRVSVILCK